MKTRDEILGTLRKELPNLKERFRVNNIGLFGSYVKGKQKGKSDLDVLVEFEEPVSLLGLVKAENYLSDLLGMKVDLVPAKDIRPELRNIIQREAVYL